MDRAAIERTTEVVLRAIGNDESLSAPALTFMLRRYAATERDDIREALEAALTRAVEQPQPTGPDRAQWLILFAEASAASSDDRLRTIAVTLVDSLRHDWGDDEKASDIGIAAAGIDACLVASEVCDTRDVVSEAVDELERIIGLTYRPGEGVGPGRLIDQIRAATALLTAFGITARLPYSMLADELVQFAKRTMWDTDCGGFYDDLRRRAKSFVTNCEAARVLCRLQLLYRREQYRSSAVIARDADYAHDAELTLAALDSNAKDEATMAAEYGLALEEWLRL